MTAGYLPGLTREMKSGDIQGDRRKKTGAQKENLDRVVKPQWLWNFGEKGTASRASIPGMENWRNSPLGSKHEAAWKSVPGHFNSETATEGQSWGLGSSPLKVN